MLELPYSTAVLLLSGLKFDQIAAHKAALVMGMLTLISIHVVLSCAGSLF